MPNSTRSELKREIERAKGNLDWYIHHLETVHQTMFNAVENNIENDFDIPEVYAEIVNDILCLTEACKELSKATDKLYEHF